MAIGHVKLGIPGALRNYIMVDPKGRTKTLANPMAAKLGTGAGTYEDMQNWASWLQEDWQAGLGKKDTEAGGFLYATAETRFPNRLMLSPAPTVSTTQYTNDYAYQAGYYAPNQNISVGASSSVKMVAQKFTAQSVVQHFVNLYLKNDGKSVKVEVYANSSNKPTGSALNIDSVPTASATIVCSDSVGTMGYSNYLVYCGYGLTAGTTYHVVLSPLDPLDTLSIPSYDTAPANTASVYVLGAWANTTASLLQMGVIGDYVDSNVLTKLVLFNNILYASAGGYVLKFSGGVWTLVYSAGNAITDLCRAGDTLYIALGTGHNALSMSTAEVITALVGVQAQKLALYNGLLWRGIDANVYYTGDGATWTGPISVAETGEQIRGMAGQGDYLYVSTDSSLYYIGFGDQVRSVSPWPSIDSTNGAMMKNHQGSLFITLGRSLLRFDSGSMLPVGPDLGEGLPSFKEGNIVDIVSTNYWLLVAVNPTLTTGNAQVWAWNSQGWHHVVSLPKSSIATGSYITSMIYDRTTKLLYIASYDEIMYSVLLPDAANYSSNTTQRYSPFGWLETDWFFGGLKEIYKDCESVYVAGDNIDSNNYVEVYWKDDDSTAWEMLGTVTSDRTELRWSDYNTRPNTRQIKLGLALYSKVAGSTPIVRAVRVKFMPMVQDRYRWSLPIAVSDNQQMPDGKVNPYNAKQMRAHLKTLLTRVPPFIFEDVDGEQYEVKVLAATEQLERWVLTDGRPDMQNVYSLTIEQATTDTYGG